MRAELDGARPRQREHEVDTVEERARDTVPVTIELHRRARALRGRIAAGAAGAQVHRPDELEARRERRAAADARDRDDAVFERLPQRLEGGTRKLGELVEQEDAAVRERDLARARRRPAANQGRRRDGVVRRAEGRRAQQPCPRRKQSGDRMDAGDLEGVDVVEPRQDPRQAPGEHRLADPGRPRQQQVVPARGRELERPARTLLAAHVGEVGHRLRELGLGRRLGLGRVALTAEVLDGLDEMADRDGADAGERHLGARLGRADEALEPAAPGTLGGGKRSGNGAQPAVERELADGGVAGEVVGG